MHNIFLVVWNVELVLRVLWQLCKEVLIYIVHSYHCLKESNHATLNNNTNFNCIDTNTFIVKKTSKSIIYYKTKMHLHKLVFSDTRWLSHFGLDVLFNLTFTDDLIYQLYETYYYSGHAEHHGVNLFKTSIIYFSHKGFNWTFGSYVLKSTMLFYVQKCSLLPSPSLTMVQIKHFRTLKSKPKQANTNCKINTEQ